MYEMVWKISMCMEGNEHNTRSRSLIVLRHVSLHMGTECAQDRSRDESYFWIPNEQQNGNIMLPRKLYGTATPCELGSLPLHFSISLCIDPRLKMPWRETREFFEPMQILSFMS